MKRLCYSKCDILKSCEKIIIVVLQPFGLFRFPWYLSHFDDNIWNLISIATCHHKCFIGSTHWVWMRVASIPPRIMRSLLQTNFGQFSKLKTIQLFIQIYNFDIFVVMGRTQCCQTSTNSNILFRTSNELKSVYLPMIELQHLNFGLKLTDIEHWS